MIAAIGNMVYQQFTIVRGYKECCYIFLWNLIPFLHLSDHHTWSKAQIVQFISFDEWWERTNWICRFCHCWQISMWGENQSKLVIILIVGNLTQCLLISTPLKAEYLNALHWLVEGHHIYAKWILDKSLSLPRWSEIVLVLFLAIQTFNGLGICSVYFTPLS